MIDPGSLPLVVRSNENIFEAVREGVDLTKFYPFSDKARAFDRYYLDVCIAPDHTDSNPSMLVYTDGVRCQGCGFKADTVDLYLAANPHLTPFEAAEELLDRSDLQLDRDRIVPERQLRSLDPADVTRHHLALLDHPDAIEELQEFGFTLDTIRTFKLGVAQVRSLLLPGEEELVDDAEEYNGRFYQLQWRLAVPVFANGQYRQCIYRRRKGALGVKTMLEKNAGSGWLFNGDALRKNPESVYFVGGWGDVLALSQWGMTAVASISGDGYFNPEWFADLKERSQVYVVNDVDAAGEKMRERFQREIPWARAISLPFEPGSGKDVRDFYNERSEREFLALRRMADVASNWQLLKKVNKNGDKFTGSTASRGFPRRDRARPW